MALKFMNYEVQSSKNLTSLLAEMKDELKDFAQTRVTMLRAELKEKARALKSVAPLGVVAIVFLATSYLLITLALVGLIVAGLLGNPYRWAIAFGCVGFLWGIVGASAAYFVRRNLMQAKGLLPRRTVEVLKADKLWIQSEMRNQI